MMVRKPGGDGEYPTVAYPKEIVKSPGCYGWTVMGR